ncbi:hypothetical protein ACFV90_33415 [Streptomyces sp. NPDC059904]|uniref:hypothetical protein n=1 Tax=Streptomyces sp. NPDC059904 TaxID=3346996 RepID=UPI00366A4B17
MHRHTPTAVGVKAGTSPDLEAELLAVPKAVPELRRAVRGTSVSPASKCSSVSASCWGM